MRSSPAPNSPGPIWRTSPDRVVDLAAATLGGANPHRGRPHRQNLTGGDLTDANLTRPTGRHGPRRGQPHQRRSRGADFVRATLTDAILPTLSSTERTSTMRSSTTPFCPGRRWGGRFHSGDADRRHPQRCRPDGAKLTRHRPRRGQPHQRRSRGADFVGATLTDAILRDAVVDGANFDDAVLDNAVLSGRRWGGRFLRRR